MASSVKGVTPTMRTALNPNAAEFVPSILRASSSSSNIPDVIKPKPARDSRKAILHGSDFTTSCASDNESQYQQFQLPDDITPDFGLLEVNGFLSAESISSEGSSAFDYTSTSKPFVTETIMENKQGNHSSFHRMQEISPHEMCSGYANGHSKFALPQNVEEKFSGRVESLSPSRAWEHHSFARDRQMVQIRNGQHSSTVCDIGFFGELLKQPFADEKETDPVNLLALEFPGFAAENLADIFHANGNDLNMTIEILTQLQQASPVYLIGNKSIAKEFSAKGQGHNGQMKTVHDRTGKELFFQRNLVTALPNHSQEQTQLIDLHELHESEAIRVLKHELAVLRNTARSRYQQQKVLICIGGGHHTKGSCTPARLPMAVERYLVEDEHLDYSEPQPGMLLVVV